jgi:DNA-binding IclR family transcriptional regulator
VRAPLRTPKNNSVGKAFQILRTLSSPRREMTATEVASAIGTSVATVHRFLVTLEEIGVVMRTERGRFQLGMALAALGDQVQHNKLLIGVAQPHLDELAARFREVSLLAVRSGRHAMYVARGAPDRMLQADATVGGMAPLHCTAVGKVLLAYLPPSARDRHLADLALTRYTDRTLVDRETLRAALRLVTASGHAQDEEEWEDGLRGIAVPVRDRHGEAVAALAVSAPSSRMKQVVLERCRVELQLRAAAISRRLFVESRVFPGMAHPRGNFPHLKRVGDLIFISGTSARRPDDSFEGVQVRSDGSVSLDIRRQTKAVFDNIRYRLA